MRRLPKLGAILAAVVLALGAVSTGAQAATVGEPISGHSHWDDPNADYEIKFCYEVLDRNPAATASQSKMIAFMPFREVDAKNFMQLTIQTDGLRLSKRISGVTTVLTPTFATSHVFGVGSDVMVDLVSVGNTFTVYELLPDKTRGPKWYEWTDSTYSKGVNYSYYTPYPYSGQWEFVDGTPLDSVGVGHHITGLFQDARNHPSQTGEQTFDSPIPANGGVTGASAAKSGSRPNWGLASGTNYTYTFTVNKAGAGTFDFRDPATPDQKYWVSSFYRLTLGTTPKIQRFNGASAGATFNATTGSGGPGTYTLKLTGPVMTLTAPSGAGILTVNDGGPQSGIRVRLAPGDQTWTWTGTAN